MYRWSDFIHPSKNFLIKIRDGGRASEGYGIFLSDCKFDIDRHICDRSDDHPGFLPVQGASQDSAWGCRKREDARKKGSVVAGSWNYPDTDSTLAVWNADESRRNQDYPVIICRNLSGGEVWIRAVSEAS